MIAKYPQKGSKVNSILYINDPMSRVESQKADKSEKTPIKHCVSKQSTEPYKYQISEVLLYP